MQRNRPTESINPYLSSIIIIYLWIKAAGRWESIQPLILICSHAANRERWKRKSTRIGFTYSMIKMPTWKISIRQFWLGQIPPNTGNLPPSDNNLSDLWEFIWETFGVSHFERIFKFFYCIKDQAGRARWTMMGTHWLSHRVHYVNERHGQSSWTNLHINWWAYGSTITVKLDYHRNGKSRRKEWRSLDRTLPLALGDAPKIIVIKFRANLILYKFCQLPPHGRNSLHIATSNMAGDGDDREVQ